MISGICVYYPDGKQTQRIGIVHDIKVEPTINGVKQGKDEVLKKQLKLLTNSKRQNHYRKHLLREKFKMNKNSFCIFPGLCYLCI